MHSFENCENLAKTGRAGKMQVSGAIGYELQTKILRKLKIFDSRALMSNNILTNFQVCIVIEAKIIPIS